MFSPHFGCWLRGETDHWITAVRPSLEAAPGRHTVLPASQSVSLAMISAKITRVNTTPEQPSRPGQPSPAH